MRPLAQNKYRTKGSAAAGEALPGEQERRRMQVGKLACRAAKR